MKKAAACLLTLCLSVQTVFGGVTALAAGTGTETKARVSEETGQDGGLESAGKDTGEEIGRGSEPEENSAEGEGDGAAETLAPDVSGGKEETTETDTESTSGTETPDKESSDGAAQPEGSGKPAGAEDVSDTGAPDITEDQTAEETGSADTEAAGKPAGGAFAATIQKATPGNAVPEEGWEQGTSVYVELQTTIAPEGAVFTVSLTEKGEDGEEGDYAPQELFLEAAEPEETGWFGRTVASSIEKELTPQKGSVSFDGLEPGSTYTVTITGDGYAPWSQEVKAGTKKGGEWLPGTAKVTLTDTFLSIYDYSSQSKKGHPGVFRLGELDDDEDDDTIDDKDLKVLLDRMSAGMARSGPSGASEGDLNGDGMVDLLDLHLFSLFYKNEGNTEAQVEYVTVLAPEAVKASASNATPAELDNIEAMFSGSVSVDTGSAEPIALAPKDPDKEISEKNPVELSVAIGGDDGVVMEGMVIGQPSDAEGVIDGGTVAVEYLENGETKEVTLEIPKQGEESEGRIRTVRTRRGRSGRALKKETGGTLTRDSSGNLVLDLGGQVAVKKISIKVTSIAKKHAQEEGSYNLAEISRVEYVNDMENRIPAPELSIPEITSVENGSGEFTVSWTSQGNVTGYQLRIADGMETEIVDVSSTKAAVEKFKDGDIKNGKVYLVSVRSVNGSWKSDWSDAAEARPEANEKPAPPDFVEVIGGYKILKISWDNMDDTDFYTIYYRKKGEEEWQKQTDIKTNGYTLKGLEDKTVYEIQVTGSNKLGESGPSVMKEGKTTVLQEPETPDYMLHNRRSESGKFTDHIEKAELHEMGQNAEATVDGVYETSWVVKDWDAGVYYPCGHGIGKGPIITFDEPFAMDTLVIEPDNEQSYIYTDCTVFYWEEGKEALGQAKQAKGTFSRKQDENGLTYYEFKLNKIREGENASPRYIEPVKIQVNLTNQYGIYARISIAELKFYEYDDIEDRIYDLYEDDMHVELKDGVNQKAIDSLRAELDEKDPESGELHPNREALLKELENAEQILNDELPSNIIEIHNGVTMAADNHLKFQGGLNAWQPIGITARPGEQLTIYVGGRGKKVGQNTNLRLVATQYYSEGNRVYRNVQKLKAGANIVTIPSVADFSKEPGGQLYIEYTGKKNAEEYKVRVSGGERIPYLDLTKTSDPDEQLALAEAYVEELSTYSDSLKARHEELHQNAAGTEGTEAFDPTICTLGATDIVSRNMMLSLSAPQILEGLSGGENGGDSNSAMAKRLVESMEAMDEMIDLFYQHKGLSNDPGTGNKGGAGPLNALPSGRLNIRYSRMFDGAFMYAGGRHIGIGWGSQPGMVQGIPMETDENGRYKSGKYFGWGIAHEIGHEIDAGPYEINEVTNNYFAVLAQSDDTRNTVGFSYEPVYEKVTSNTKGKPADVFTQLAMYWQLHLAYDKGYNFKTYDTYQEQFDNLFFARVDSYVRDSKKKPDGAEAPDVGSGDTDNKLMRLACAAAERNILPFFERWGMTPDQTTRQYAEQFPDEERAIWLVNDDSRTYTLENEEAGSIAAQVKVTVSLPEVRVANSDRVTLEITNNAENQEAMLGYEIYRSQTVFGQTERVPVGFVEIKDGQGTVTFTDHVDTINNRVFTYDAVGYDKFLYPTERSNSVSEKVSHGNISKAGWTVSTNMVSAEDTGITEGSPDVPVRDAIQSVIDGKTDAAYRGSSSEGAPEIVIGLNGEETVTGFTYDKGDGQGITAYDFYISEDGEEWEKVKSGSFDWENTEEGVGRREQIVYLSGENGYLNFYSASYVKLVATSQKGEEISIAEIGIMGQTGDNVEWMSGEASVGRLAEDFTAGTGSDGTVQTIPKGSVVFTGTYKGNPAYNMVLLYDEEGNIVGGADGEGNLLAYQYIFAPVPENGELGEVTDGIWVYYIEPQDVPETLPSRVRAELYRVDNAETNENSRMVSDTELLSVPEPDSLPSITIKGADGALS